MQKYSDDIAIVGYIADGQETEYRGLVEDFLGWFRSNHLQLNISKLKKMVVDFRRKRTHNTNSIHHKGSIKRKNAGHLDRLMRRAGSVVGT